MAQTCEIAKACPKYISSAVRVSSCSHQKTFFRLCKKNWVVRILVSQFYHNFSFWALLRFEFLSSVLIWGFEFYHNFIFLSFLAIWVFGICCYFSFVTIGFLDFWDFWVVTIWVFEICHYLNFQVLSKFLSFELSQCFATNLFFFVLSLFLFCYNSSFWVLS